MIDELLTYYNNELAFLREEGAEFAEKYPRVAARLLMEADKCEDHDEDTQRGGFTS